MASHRRRRPADPAIGLRIEVRMLRLGISQSELARRLTVTPGCISHYICGRTEPSGARMRALAAALDTSVAWLTGEALSKEERSLEIALLQIIRAGGAALADALERVDPAAAATALLGLAGCVNGTGGGSLGDSPASARLKPS